jgi:Right handed beta helix region
MRALRAVSGVPMGGRLSGHGTIRGIIRPIWISQKWEDSMMPRYLATFSILALSVLLGAMGTASALPGICPSPTMWSGGSCVLEHDVTLAASETLVLRSFTQLNCQGHTITPSAVGTGTDITQRSKPEVAILLTEASGVQIFNCNIHGFDFGIFAINSKVPEQVTDPAILSDRQNTILGNVINARFTPISLMFVDNTHIIDNHLSYNTNGGVGLTVERNSHRNHIINNDITGNFTAMGAVRVPGPKGASNPEFTVMPHGAAILIAQVGGPPLFNAVIPLLFNGVVENTLYQLDATKGARLPCDPSFPPHGSDKCLVPNDEFTADNVVDGNSITFLGGNRGLNDGIALALPQRTKVSNNRVEGARIGMRAGIQIGTRQFPGTCSGNTSRLCLADPDCDIPGVDIGSQGTCIDKQDNVVDWFSKDTIMENNIVLMPTPLWLHRLSISTELRWLAKIMSFGEITLLDQLDQPGRTQAFTFWESTA